jgi:hypothetical protein
VESASIGVHLRLILGRQFPVDGSPLEICENRRNLRMKKQLLVVTLRVFFVVSVPFVVKKPGFLLLDQVEDKLRRNDIRGGLFRWFAYFAVEDACVSACWLKGFVRSSCPSW